MEDNINKLIKFKNHAEKSNANVQYIIRKSKNITEHLIDCSKLVISCQKLKDMVELRVTNLLTFHEMIRENLAEEYNKLLEMQMSTQQVSNENIESFLTKEM